MVDDPRPYVELGEIHTVFFVDGTGWGENEDGSMANSRFFKSPMTGVVSHACSEDLMLIRIGDDLESQMTPILISCQKDHIIAIV